MVFNNSILAGASSIRDFYDYQIEQSLRFNEASQAYLRKTDFSGSPTSDQTGTFSVWVKNTLSYTNSRNAIYGSATGSAAFTALSFVGDSQVLDLRTRNTGSTDIIDLIGNPAQRDPSAWYHIMSVYDLTNATRADRARIYVNGVRLTNFSIETLPNNTTTTYDTGDFLTDMQIGRTNTNSSNMFYADFILAEYHRVDGQALDPTSFGEFKSGVWTPKEYTGTYGNHGFYLDFADTSDIGKDVSGNSNGFTANNLSAHDVMPDSPTNNYCIYNNADPHESTLSEGNLKVVTPTSSSLQYGVVRGTHAMTSGKWYWEVYMQAISGSGANNQFAVGITNDQNDFQNFLGGDATDFSYFGFDGKKYNDSTSATYGDTFTTGDIVSVAYDADDGNLFFYKNGTIQNSGTAAYTGISGTFFPAKSDGNQAVTVTMVTNFGQDGTFLGQVTAGNNSDGNGYGNFKYAVPSGFLALNSANLPEPSISPLNNDIPEDYFEANLWTGNGTSQSISSYEFAPDWVWIKERNSTSSHYLVDTIRGTDVFLQSNSTVADTSNTVNVTSFDSNGFSLGTGGTTNENNNTYVGWAWLAGTSFSNSAGANGADIASSGSVNTKSGFSIVSYTGSNSANDVVYHGIGTAPSLIIIKNRDVGTSSGAWGIFTDRVEAERLQFDTNPDFNNYPIQSFDANTFQLPTLNNIAWSAANNYIAYCFANIEGFSKIGIYDGNSSNNGTYVHTGFSPAFVMSKVANGGSGGWIMHDNKRGSSNEADPTITNNNVMDDYLLADSNGTEDTGINIDFLSNGFKWRSASSSTTLNHNVSGDDYIYMAFAEMPFKYANAR